MSTRPLPSVVLCLLGLLLTGPASVRSQSEPDLEPYVLVDQWPEKTAMTGALLDPVGLDVGPDDTVYISDAGMGGIHVLLPTGDFEAMIGSTGEGPERLAGAGPLAVDQAQGRLYALDTSSKRVVAYGLDGAFVTAWGGVDGVAITARDGRVYVADRERNQVLAFDSAGQELYAIGRPGTEDGAFSQLRAVSVDPTGSVLAVGDMDEMRAQLFDLKQGGASLRRSYDLRHPRYDQRGRDESAKCRAGVVHALGEDTVWVGDGTGACRLTPDGFEYVIAVSVAESTVCKHSIRLPRVRPDTGQYLALGVYNPNEGTCTRKDDKLPTTPVVLRYQDPELRSAMQLVPVTAKVTGGGLLAPTSLTMPDEDSLFLEDLSPELRFFDPPGASLATSARYGEYRSDEPGDVLRPYWILRATGTDVPGEVFAYYKRKEGRLRFSCGVGRFRTVERRVRTETVRMIEPIWLDHWGDYGESIYGPLCSRGGLRHAVAVRDLAYNAVTGEALVLVTDSRQEPGGTVEQPIIVRIRHDHVGVLRDWQLAQLEIQSTKLSPYVDLDVGPDGKVYVLDELDEVVHVLALDGATLATVRVASDTRNIAADAAGRIFALRRSGYVERVRAADGVVTARFDGRPFTATDPESLVGIEADGAGRVYVADGRSSLVSVFVPAGPDADSLTAPGTAECRFTSHKTAQPGRLPLGGTVGLNLGLQGRCGSGELGSDIVVVTKAFPFSGTGANVGIGLRRLLAAIDFRLHRVAIISYQTVAKVEHPLSHDRDGVLRRVTLLTRARCSDDPFAPPCLYPGLRNGMELARRQFDAASGRRQVVVLYDPEYCNKELEYHTGDCRDYPQAKDVADELRATGVRVVVTGLNAHAAPLASSDADVVLDPGAAYPRMIAHQTPAVLATDFTLTDTLPANMRLLPGSVSAPGTAAGADVVWRLPTLGYAPPAFTLAVEPQAVGLWPTNVEAVAEFTDGWGKAQRLIFPVPEVEVYAATPTPVEPTPTGPLTATASSTATPRPPTEVPTATRPPVAARPIYLPWLARSSCRPAADGLAVALVVDSSSSMAGEKLAAAQSALRTFVDSLLRGSARNRAALLSFDVAARQHTGLTADRAQLEAAVAALRTADGTRIDLGLAAGLQALAGAAGRPVLILLSDGRQDDAEAVRAAAARARAAGVEVWAIGLGADVDDELLASVASDPAHYLVAPGPADLAALYERIAAVIPCR